MYSNVSGCFAHVWEYVSWFTKQTISSCEPQLECLKATKIEYQCPLVNPLFASFKHKTWHQRDRWFDPAWHFWCSYEKHFVWGSEWQISQSAIEISFSMRRDCFADMVQQNKISPHPHPMPSIAYKEFLYRIFFFFLFSASFNLVFGWTDFPRA